ncbi:MAG: hypothetical protein PVG82_06725 [Chromatiales bacterium]|jgi:hypothetical protein
MTDQEFEKHRTELVDFLATTHRFAAVVILITFAGYAIAAYLLWKSEVLAAFVLASASFLLFRSFRRLSLRLARWRLQHRAASTELLDLLDRELRSRGAEQLVADIESKTAG